MKTTTNNILLAIVGATATGKTDLAIELAKRYDTAILSFDGRQFYRQMNIGTAKPTESQLQTVPHYFINNKHIEELYTVADFEQEALKCLEMLFEKHKLVVAVGGSGLFLNALSYGLDPIPAVSQEIVNELESRLAANGLADLLKQLKTVDFDSYQQLDTKNPRRVVRALSVFLATGNPFSQYKTKQAQARPFQTITVGIDYERNALYEKINYRVELMLQAGLEQEAKQLEQFKHLSALQTVGYTEFFEYWEGKHSYTKAVELIKQHSRNYAKRQTTWFKKENISLWLNGKDSLEQKTKQVTAFLSSLNL